MTGSPPDTARRQAALALRASGVARKRGQLAAEMVHGRTARLAAKRRSGVRRAMTRFRLQLAQALGMTRWFGPETKPARPGLYQVRVDRLREDAVEWCWWNGVRWGWAYADKRAALSSEWREAEGASQEKAWRGITADAYFGNDPVPQA